MDRKILFLALTVSCVLGTPLNKDSNITIPALVEDVLKPETTNKNSTTPVKDKLRQDGDGEEVVEGLDAVAGPIGQIISGTLSGNIGQLFNGITGTVTDQEAQPGVGTILQGVSLPLSTLWASGISAGQKYFNITTEAPQRQQGATGSPLQQQQQQQPIAQQQQPQQVQQPQAAQPSRIRPQRPANSNSNSGASNSNNEDDDDDDDSDNPFPFLKLKVKKAI